MYIKVPTRKELLTHSTLCPSSYSTLWYNIPETGDKVHITPDDLHYCGKVLKVDTSVDHWDYVWFLTGDSNKHVLIPRHLIKISFKIKGVA